MDNSHQTASKDAIAHARHGWDVFTRFTVWGAAATAVIVALVVTLITR